LLKGIAEMDKQKRLIKRGRPRLSVDYAIVLRLRDEDNLGWSRIAEAYRRITGQWISRDTVKRRYLEVTVENQRFRTLSELSKWKIKI